jgi:uncharacterized protein DUF6084
VPAAAPSIPSLQFSVEGAQAVRYAAVPTLEFRLRIANVHGEPIRAVLLDTQIQIAARRRGYDEAAEERLLDLFGTPDRWGDTLRTLPWTRTTIVVPAFEGSTEVELSIPCSYDLEVTASRYLDALADGEVPLEFLFSGAVFYSDSEGRLQTVRIGWDQDADFALPVSVWREAIERHFPDSAWLRLRKPTLDRLSAFKGRRTLATWDDALLALLDGQED